MTGPAVEQDGDVYVKYQQLTPQLLSGFKANKINILDKTHIQISFFS